MNGRMVFSQDRLLIQQVTAQTGGGTVNLGGFVGVRSGLYFDITAVGRDIRIRQQGISASADSDLRLSGTLAASTLSGDVVLNRFTVGTNFDFANLLLRSKQGTAAADPQSIANHVRLNIRITSAPQLAVETSLARLSGDVDLNVRGTALNPVILGRVNVAEGDVQFQGTKYHIDRADITFTNPARIEPVLNVEASTTVRSYDITLGFHGPMDHLQTNYRSEPPLPTADIISLLAFQRTTEEAANSQQQTTFTESAQNAVLGEALNAAVSSRIQKLFGISKVKIDPQGGGLENNKPSITVEQQVHQNLTVTFVTYPTQSNQQLIQVEYNINKNVSIVGVRDQYGVLGIDVRLRQRKR
jgi:translocation and assembly module TamB